MSTRRTFKNVAVFCGSSFGNKPDYKEAAEALGTLMGKSGIGLVYGGGSVGLMGAVANAVNDNGGEVTGVIPEALKPRELSGAGVGTVIVTDSMHTRKATMADKADAFISLPGGLGTLDELFEIATWAQLGFHNKPIGLLNICNYYQPLLAAIDNAVAEGFVRQQYRDMFVVADNPADLLEKLATVDLPESVLASKLKP